MDKILAVIIFCYIFAALGVCSMLLVRLWWGKPSRRASGEASRRPFARGLAARGRPDGVLWLGVESSSVHVTDH